MRKAGFPLIALAIAFTALGVSTNRTFLYVGLAFAFIGIAMLLRGRRG